MLYQHYTDARIAFLKHSRVSKYDSENLCICVDILKSRPQLNVICHQPLNMLIRDLSINDEKCSYAMNTTMWIFLFIIVLLKSCPYNRSGWIPLS